MAAGSGYRADCKLRPSFGVGMLFTVGKCSEGAVLDVATRRCRVYFKYRRMMLENGSANFWRENNIPLFASALRRTVTCLQCRCHAVVWLPGGCHKVWPVTSEFFERSFVVFVCRRRWAADGKTMRYVTEGAEAAFLQYVCDRLFLSFVFFVRQRSVNAAET